MSTNILKHLRAAGCMAMVALTLITTAGNAAVANIIEPDTQTPQLHQPENSIVADTREILDRASFIVFEGATAVQKLQTLSVDTATSEMLKNYMASMIYIPHALALPTDEEALDEPWMASASGTSSEDGMVVPNLDDDEPVDAKGIEIDTPANPTHTFLKLLKPVQNALITSPFGFRWGRPHQGIDMAAPVGTPILSAEVGKVVYSGWKQGYGNFVAIDHGHGYQTHYAHCSKLLVRIGQKVKNGQLIAKVGSTGHSTGPHLHFEVVANGIHRNPAKFINHTLTVVQAH
jgi:murein DD-endopeptidase MepM/ murein hydrolase activator NlpD